jgi:hypothetical protein
MAIVRRLAPRSDFSALAANNSALRVTNATMYNLLVKCRDWLKIMQAHPEKIDELDGVIRRVRKNPL